MSRTIPKQPDTDFEEIKKVIDLIDKDARTLKNRLVKLRRLMQALEWTKRWGNRNERQ